MKDLLSRLTKLIDVKSICTIVLLIVICVLVCKGETAFEETFKNIIMLVFGFFFGKKDKISNTDK